MAQPDSNPDSSRWRGCQTIASPDAYRDTVGFTEDANIQQPEQRDATSQLSSSDARKPDQMKIDMPLWLASSAPCKQLSPPQTRLKWCGCLASSSCSHFSESQTLDTDISASSKQWIPLPSFVPDGVQQYQQQEAKKYGSKGRDVHKEPYHHNIRQVAKFKAQLLAHPTYDQLLAEHVECLRVGTPVDHLQTIEAQLATMHHVAARYSGMLVNEPPLTGDEKEELDRFMAAYVTLLGSLKGRLEEHVRRHAMEAVACCWELEQGFISLTGTQIGDGCGATMSDDDEEKMSEVGLSQSYELQLLEGGDMSLGLGPLIPTESERSLMERMRQELKSELKQGYKNRISDVREEIMRKRRAGKLPCETTSILKKWWNAHSKWPYPTEDEKVRLVHETGLELKQINNWFINQRKRNWHSQSTTTSSSDYPTSTQNKKKKGDSNSYHTSATAGGGQASTASLTLSFERKTFPDDF